MTTEENKAIVRAYVSALNAGDFERLAELFGPGAQIFGVRGSGPITLALAVWRELHTGLNMFLEVQSMVAEHDIVAVRYLERGAWVGPFMGQTAPTGRAFELTAMEWFQIEHGKIMARWGARDSAALARQIGLAA